MEKPNTDTVVIIPAYNEQSALPLVLKEIPMHRVSKVIVVDNNSTDKTSEVATAAGALVVCEKRQGYGSACLKGIEVARKFHPEYLIFLDADYSDNPKEMELLWSELDKDFDLVIGSRISGDSEKGALLPQAIFGNWLATRILKVLFPSSSVEYTDLGPFRGIRMSALNKIYMQDPTYGWTVEMQTKAIIHNLRSTEVPVSYKKRIGKSKISGTIKGSLLAGYKILVTIFTLKIKSIIC